MSRPVASFGQSGRAARRRRALFPFLLGAAGALALAGDAAAAMNLASMERAQWSLHQQIEVQAERSLPVGIERVLEAGAGERLLEAKISSTVAWSGKERSGKLQLDQLFLRVGRKRYAVVGAFSGKTFYEGARLAQTVSRKKGSARKQTGVETRAVFRVPSSVRSGDLYWGGRRLRVSIRAGAAKPESAPFSARIVQVRRESELATKVSSRRVAVGAMLRNPRGSLLVVTVRVEPRRAEMWRTKGFILVYGGGAWSPAAGEIGDKGWNADRMHWAQRLSGRKGFKADTVKLVFAVPEWVGPFSLWYGRESVAQGVVPGGPGGPLAAPVTSTSSTPGRSSATVARSPGEEPREAAPSAQPGRILQLVSPMPSQTSAADLFGDGTRSSSRERYADEDDEPRSSHLLLWILLLGLGAAGAWWIRYQRRHPRPRRR